MSAEEFEKYFQERFAGQVEWYGRKAEQNQKRYRSMQWAVIVLAALTPVLIELELTGRYLHLPTLTSALVAILTAGLQSFKYQESWLNYRTTCEALRREQYYLEAVVDGYSGVTDEAQRRSLFVERVESLIARENTTWLSVQQRERPGRTQKEGVES